jgi:hypothetical protein
MEVFVLFEKLSMQDSGKLGETNDQIASLSTWSGRRFVKPVRRADGPMACMVVLWFTLQFSASYSIHASLRVSSFPDLVFSAIPYLVT